MKKKRRRLQLDGQQQDSDADESGGGLPVSHLEVRRLQEALRATREHDLNLQGKSHPALTVSGRCCAETTVVNLVHQYFGRDAIATRVSMLALQICSSARNPTSPACSFPQCCCGPC
jgi:hypothetical protein